jgi:hypothetical protein
MNAKTDDVPAMSKAKELADAICRIDTLTEYQRELIAKAAAELRRLDALEQAAEPVPVGFVQALNEHNDEWVSKLPVGTALYTRPARKPMTRDDMRKLLAEHFDNDVLTGDDFRLIRAVERFHDIKE